jgi:hypothetical protein
MRRNTLPSEPTSSRCTFEGNTKMKKVPAECAQRHLTNPDGETDICWVVTAIEEGGRSTAVFSGVDAAGRAAAYARANYGPIHFRVMAEPGHIGLAGRDMGVSNGHVQ